MENCKYFRSSRAAFCFFLGAAVISAGSAFETWRASPALDVLCVPSLSVETDETKKKKNVEKPFVQQSNVIFHTFRLNVFYDGSRFFYRFPRCALHDAVFDRTVLSIQIIINNLIRHTLVPRVPGNPVAYTRTQFSGIFVQLSYVFFFPDRCDRLGLWARIYVFSCVRYCVSVSMTFSASFSFWFFDDRCYENQCLRRISVLNIDV